MRPGLRVFPIKSNGDDLKKLIALVKAGDLARLGHGEFTTRRFHQEISGFVRDLLQFMATWMGKHIFAFFLNHEILGFWDIPKWLAYWDIEPAIQAPKFWVFRFVMYVGSGPLIRG